MDIEYEKKYHLVEKENWWFVMRRKSVLTQIRRISKNFQNKPSILEVGCSSGLLSLELQKAGFDITAMDISPEAVEKALKNGVKKVVCQDGQDIKLDENSFDIIIASDVLEHIQNEKDAVTNWLSLLKKNGVMIVYVPAFQSLWSRFDEINMHYKRYRVGELSKLMQDRGAKVIYKSYWNLFLFLPVFIIRFIKRTLGESDEAARAQINLPPKPVNFALKMLVGFENKLMSFGISLPFGISCMVIAKK